jgi:hypothetical protein
MTVTGARPFHCSLDNEMTDATLARWNHFHDWYLDSIRIGPNQEPRSLTLGLHFGSDRATIRFDGVTCFSVDGLGLLNIVYSLRLIDAANKNYDSVIAALNKGERLSKRKASEVAFLYSSLGAELAIEFDSLIVTPSVGD